MDFKILEVEYSKSWATRRGEVPFCPVFLPLPKVEDMLIFLVSSQGIVGPYLLMVKSICEKTSVHGCHFLSSFTQVAKVVF